MKRRKLAKRWKRDEPMMGKDVTLFMSLHTQAKRAIPRTKKPGDRAGDRESAIRRTDVAAWKLRKARGFYVRDDGIICRRVRAHR